MLQKSIERLTDKPYSEEMKILHEGSADLLAENQELLTILKQFVDAGTAQSPELLAAAMNQAYAIVMRRGAASDL